MIHSNHPTDTAAPQSREATYICRTAAIVAVALACFVFFGLIGRDHFWSKPLNGDPDWYQSTSNLVRPEMQDRELLFHAIGQSIANARQADIVILGNSVLKYGLNYELMARFEHDHGVRIFNLNISGLASGEFLKRLILHWDIRPKIWILNALDYPADFFLPVIVDRFTGGPASAENIAVETWRAGYARVVARNLRWAVDEMVIDYLPAGITDRLLPGLRQEGSWRSARDGNQYLELSERYLAKHAPIKVIRDQDCHADAEQIQLARNFTRDIGGTVILMQMPYERWCPQRVREMASALGMSTILTPDANYTVMDGTHLDKEGAVAFTQFFLAALVKTPEFRNLTALSPARTPPLQR